MKKIYSWLPLIAVFISCFFACRKPLEKPSWDVAVIAPVVHTTLTLNNLIPDSLLQVNPDNSITLVFDNTVYELDSIIAIPDTTISETYKSPVNFDITVNPGSPVINATGESNYDLNGAELTEVHIKEGTLFYHLTSTIQEQTDYTYSLPKAFLNGDPGQPFYEVITLAAASPGVPATASGSFDMAGYHIDLRGASGTEFNTLETFVNVTTDINGAPVLVTTTDSVYAENTFSGVLPSYAKGYFGQQQENVGPEETEFDVFDMITSGTIDIDAVNVTLEIVNGIGAEAAATINSLASINTSTNNTVNLTHSSIGNTININRGFDNNGVVTPSVHSINLNEGNSNIDLFLENLPNRLSYESEVILNPLGNTSGGNDFFYCDNTFEINLNVSLPLCLIANNLTLVDTVDFSVTQDSSGRFIDGIVKVYAENGFPIGSDLILYILDDNGLAVDSIISTSTIAPGVVNASNVVTATTLSLLEIPVNEIQADLLYGAERIALKASFSTASQLPPHFKFYDHYALDLRVIADFNYHISPQ
jgi:hypothetical protein